MQKIVEINLKFKAHGSLLSDEAGQIQSLLVLKDKYLSVGLDCQVKLWTFDSKPVASAFVTGDYPLCMCQVKENIIIGNGYGQIIFFNAQLQQQKSIKVAKDTISGILQTQEHIIVLSHDGTVTVLLKSNHQLFKRIDLQYPISQICQYKDNFYIAGSKSWKISSDFQKVEEIQRSYQFMVYRDEILGVSPDKGFYSYSRQLFSYEPCDFIAVVNDRILGFFSNGMSLFVIDADQISTKSQMIKQWKQGYIVKSVCLKSQSNFLVGREDGSITDLTLLL